MILENFGRSGRGRGGRGKDLPFEKGGVQLLGCFEHLPAIQVPLHHHPVGAGNGAEGGGCAVGGDIIVGLIPRYPEGVGLVGVLKVTGSRSFSHGGRAGDQRGRGGLGHAEVTRAVF